MAVAAVGSASAQGRDVLAAAGVTQQLVRMPRLERRVVEQAAQPTQRSMRPTRFQPSPWVRGVVVEATTTFWVTTREVVLVVLGAAQSYFARPWSRLMAL